MGPRSTRGKWALALAALGGVILIASAFNSWAQPSRVPWPSYTDGVPDRIAHPSDLLLRLGAALLGAAALAAVGLARRGVAHPLPWLALALVGPAAVVVGVVGLDTVSHYRGFGSMIANDMTLSGFRHGPLNYAELAGAALVCLSPLAATLAALRGAVEPRRGPRPGRGSAAGR